MNTYRTDSHRVYIQFVVVVVISVTFGSAWADGARDKPPNIVLILADDWAHMDLGSAGHPLLKTPNLDRLAREGVHFTKAFTPNPICTPSRAALLTGQDNWTNGCWFFGMPIRDSSRHFAELLSEAGYETFYTGKWHNNSLPSMQGFTAGKYIGGGGPGTGGHPKPMIKDFGGKNKRQIKRFDSELFTDAAVEFLASQESDDKPFLLFVSYMTPHDPWTPPGQYTLAYDPPSIHMPPNFMPRPMNGSVPFKYYTDWHGVTLRDEKQMQPFPRTPEGLRDVRSRYYGTITHDDHQIGRIMDTLDQRHLTDNTLVIFLADHGISLGAHGISGKQTMYEEGIRLPLIMRYPRLTRGHATNGDLVSLIDIFPTLCEVAGVQIPKSIEGKSLLDPYQGKRSWDRREIFSSFVSPTKHRLNSRCIRTKRHKLIHHLTTNETELYDLQYDPFELHNLAGLKPFTDLQRQLEERLAAWRVESEGLLFSENFDAYPDGPNLPEGWWHEGSQAVSIDRGRLRADANLDGSGEDFGTSTVWLNRRFQGDIQVAFNAHVLASEENNNNINFFFLFSDPTGKPLFESRNQRADAKYGKYHTLNGYVFTFLATDTSDQARFRMRDDPGFNLLLEKNAYACQQGTTYHIVITKRGQRITYAVDGRVTLDVVDDTANPEHKAGIIGFRTWRTDLWWDNLTVTQLR